MFNQPNRRNVTKTYSRLGKRQRDPEADTTKRRRVEDTEDTTKSLADGTNTAAFPYQQDAVHAVTGPGSSSPMDGFINPSSTPTDPDSCWSPTTEGSNWESSPPSSPPTDMLAASVGTPIAVKSTPRTLPRQQLKQRPPLVQMQLNLGPCPQRTCRDCGMTYVQSSPDDMSLHAKFHKRHAEGLDVGKPFRRHAEDSAIWSGPENHLVVIVDGLNGSFEQRKVQQILAIAQAELGAVDIPDGELWRTLEDEEDQTNVSAGMASRRRSCYRAFVYLSGLKCVGLCLAKAICEAHTTLPTTSTQEGLFISEERYPARVGISRIWVSRTHRRHGIAKTLLDNVKRRFMDGFHVPKELIAFSQPTTSGAKLARSWYRKEHGWPVYID